MGPDEFFTSPKQFRCNPVGLGVGVGVGVGVGLGDGETLGLGLADGFGDGDGEGDGLADGEGLAVGLGLGPVKELISFVCALTHRLAAVRSPLVRFGSPSCN